MQYKPQDAQFAETLQDKFVVLLALVYGVIFTIVFLRVEMVLMKKIEESRRWVTRWNR